ncbi:uncharacterized protein CEXT_336341 [Caerostris extrusa]|uniref:Uncharacterized protein n=1 Tax=Caerostris extrusa TaxID=172846 RepID=A0AAV4UYA2_CAEEX|nr:uncharacterized protein CEXT_336341 [Caerostris extrusa]
MHQKDRSGTSRHYRVFEILTKTDCLRQIGPFRRSSSKRGTFAHGKDNRSCYFDLRIATGRISGSCICKNKTITNSEMDGKERIKKIKKMQE